MNITSLFSMSDLKKMTDGGYVSVRMHDDEPSMAVLNYTAKAQYERVWNDVTLTCRGLIVRGAKVTARPFKKFFNLGELESVPDGPFVAQEKMDGSLGIIYRAPDGLPAVATRGSFNSDQAVWATKFLRDRISLREDAERHLEKGETPLVEIIYPENRIVIDYGNFRGLVGLTAIDNETGEDVPLSWSGTVAQVYPEFTLDIFKSEDGEGPSAGGFNREGIVLRWADGTRAKVKFEEYVRLHRIITGVTERSIWEMLCNGHPIASLAEYVPDEFFSWMKDVEKRLREEYSSVENACFGTLGQVNRMEPRKSQAEFILSQPNSGIVFKMLDGKPYRDQIWAMIRPAATTAKVENEAD